MITTQLIVLAKQPYRESALLLTGLSPDFGRTALVAHGAQSLSEKKFPEADLFRELEVEFNDEKQGDLFTASRLELLTAFDGIADTPLHFKMAGKIGGFLLKNSAVGVPLPYTYDTLRSVLLHLSGAGMESHWDLMQCSVVLKTVFLYENGLLPAPQSEDQNEFTENLVAAGIEGSALPECPGHYWKNLNDWLTGLFAYNQLNY